MSLKFSADAAVEQHARRRVARIREAHGVAGAQPAVLVERLLR